MHKTRENAGCAPAPFASDRTASAELGPLDRIVRAQQPCRSQLQANRWLSRKGCRVPSDDLTDKGKQVMHGLLGSEERVAAKVQQGQSFEL